MHRHCIPPGNINFLFRSLDQLFWAFAIFKSAAFGFVAFPVAWLCHHANFGDTPENWLSLGSFSQLQTSGACRGFLATRSFSCLHCFLSNLLQLLSWNKPEPPRSLPTRHSKPAFVLLQPTPSASHGSPCSSATSAELIGLLPKRKGEAAHRLEDTVLHCEVHSGASCCSQPGTRGCAAVPCPGYRPVSGMALKREFC